MTLRILKDPFKILSNGQPIIQRTIAFVIHNTHQSIIALSYCVIGYGNPKCCSGMYEYVLGQNTKKI